MPAGSGRFDHVVERVPEPSRGYVRGLLHGRCVDVRLTRPRHTKLGDYRSPRRAGEPHRITVNDDLNAYAFLTTLLHEIAHLVTHETYARRVRPHGREWKKQFRLLLAPVVGVGGLPDDVVAALSQSMQNLRAASCSDRGLQEVLRRYDAGPRTLTTVESLPDGGVFRLATGRVFRKGPRLRSRYRCIEVGSGREYRVRADSRADAVDDDSAKNEEVA